MTVRHLGDVCIMLSIFYDFFIFNENVVNTQKTHRKKCLYHIQIRYPSVRFTI